MRTLFTTVLLLLLVNKSHSQNPDSLQQAANEAVKTFTWDIQKEKRGALMFLDVAYQRDNSDSVEYLTLTVAKDKTRPRPEFISIIVSDNVVKSNGIFVTFANSVVQDGVQSMEMQKARPVRVNFEACAEGTCTARMVNGFASHENGEKEDVFQNFLAYDHVLVLFIYPGGSHKSVAVPLFTFKRQYKSL
jgi:hypothetical protein